MLALWMGLSVAGTFNNLKLQSLGHQGPRTQLADDDAIDSRAALIEMVLGGERICGGEEDPEAAVFCGGELLASLLADPSVLVMSRSTCSLLLERLYEAETCSLADGGCRAVPGDLPPTSPRLSLAPVAVQPGGHSDLYLLAQARAQMRADADGEPDSFRARPPTPPPRCTAHV